jgi:hypothetical protein
MKFALYGLHRGSSLDRLIDHAGQRLIGQI